MNELQPRDQCGQFGGGFESCDAIELGLNCGETTLFYS